MNPTPNRIAEMPSSQPAALGLLIRGSVAMFSILILLYLQWQDQIWRGKRGMFDGLFLKPFHVRFIMSVRHHPGLEELQAYLDETEAHQVGSERHGRVYEPCWPFQVWRDRPFWNITGRDP